MTTCYTIQRGDCLWNIAKRTYGDNLKSNGDIAKAVQYIAESNNISNPDLIYSGINLALPDYNSIFCPEQEGTQENQNTQEENASQNLSQSGPDQGNSASQTSSAAANNANTTNIYEEYDKWLDDSELVMQEFEDYNEYLENRESYNVPLTFDFMEGKDVSDDDMYNEQTLKMGQGEIEAKDYNKDGEVAFEEYITQELDGGIIDEYKSAIAANPELQDGIVENLVDAYKTAYKLFKIIDNQMGGDNNGTLNAQEFQNYYEHLDEYTGGSGNSVRDGKFDIDYVTEYPEFLTGQISLSEEDEEKLSQSARNIVKILLNIA